VRLGGQAGGFVPHVAISKDPDPEKAKRREKMRDFLGKIK
jgi:hypothetical protein